jgi:hypothetical protein
MSDGYREPRLRDGCSRASSPVRTYPNNPRKGDNLGGDRPDPRRNRRNAAETASRSTTSSSRQSRFESGEPNRSCRHHSHSGGYRGVLPSSNIGIELKRRGIFVHFLAVGTGCHRLAQIGNYGRSPTPAA